MKMLTIAAASTLLLLQKSTDTKRIRKELEGNVSIKIIIILLKRLCVLYPNCILKIIKWLYSVSHYLLLTSVLMQIY